jgi:hypothetical protein
MIWGEECPPEAVQMAVFWVGSFDQALAIEPGRNEARRLKRTIDANSPPKDQCLLLILRPSLAGNLALTCGYREIVNVGFV